eukprot:scaffold146841_cov24-Tisochrysis_lutea.AAC.1
MYWCLDVYRLHFNCIACPYFKHHHHLWIVHVSPTPGKRRKQGGKDEAQEKDGEEVRAVQAEEEEEEEEVSHGGD